MGQVVFYKKRLLKNPKLENAKIESPKSRLVGSLVGLGRHRASCEICNAVPSCKAFSA